MTPEDVVNNALTLVKKPRIASFYDGSEEALKSLDIYVQTRDELLSTLHPNWSRKDAVLTVKRQAPADFYQSVNWDSTYPPFPYYFSYSYPTDCLVPLQVKPRPFLALPPWRPRYIPFREANDALDGTNVLLTNQSFAALIYIARIIDPNIWHEEFTNVVIQSLAQKFMSQKEPARADAA